MSQSLNEDGMIPCIRYTRKQLGPLSLDLLHQFICEDLLNQRHVSLIVRLPEAGVVAFLFGSDSQITFSKRSVHIKDGNFHEPKTDIP
jgi:hypothetical protein